MSRKSSILFHGSSSFESFGVCCNSLILSWVTTATFSQSNVALFAQNLGDKVLSEMGLRIVRFRNEEVVKDLSVVLGKIQELVR
jgi:hypothetical protein